MDGMTLEKLQVIIEAQTSQYLKAMQKVQSQTNSTVSKVQTQVSKIKNVISGIAKTVGIALSVAALVNFGKQCIELGSDLQEVQNVVDVTFGEMSSTIDQFAKDAIEKFGLSELAAKQYTSTMGAMLKSMGFTGQAVSDMSMELAGLAGDMASFYNLEADEAFAKIRAGISGETEPLKQLGINLSVANLEQFALTQGINKSYNAMTQQEQALLRYNYLLSVTSDAQGDFARTSDSWANQTKILAMRFDSLKASIGQGLINVFTPVIKVLNTLIAKLQVAADAFKRFTEIITGRKSESASSSVGNIATGLDTATNNANSLTGATNAAGGSAKKAAEAYSGLGGFDEINSLSKNADSGGGSGIGSDLGIGEEAAVAAEETDTQLNPVLQALIDKLKELRDIFKDGFKAGLGDVTLEPLKKAIKGIRESLVEIFTAPEVLGAADTWLNRVTYAAGQITGAVASIGITVATNLVGGVDKYLEQNTGRIKQFIVNMFDITGDIAEIQGNFAQAAANIFSVFGGENGQQVTANLIGIFANASMGVYELMGKAGRDILDVFTRPFIDNQEGIKTALDGILEAVVTVTGSIKDTVDEFVEKANEVYDASFGPMFEAIATGLSDTAGRFIEFWNVYVKPVLDELAGKFSGVMEEHIQPMLSKILEFCGSVADAVTALWNGIVKPFIDWLIAYILPTVVPIFNTIVSTIMAMAGNIADIIGGVIDVIRGIIDFVVGIFTGDWEKAWNGILAIVDGVMNTIKGVIELVMNAIGGVISTILNTISTIFSTILHGIASLVTTIFNAIRTAITTALATIKGGISTGLNSIKTIFTTVFTSIKTTVVTIFNSIWSAIKGVINSIIGGVESMANAVVGGINTVINALNNLSFDIPDWVPEFGGKTFGFNIPTLSTVSLPRLATGGIVDGATPLIAGEAGREAILPLENNTGWMDSLASRMGEIISVNIMGALENISNVGQEMIVKTYVTLNGKTLVEQTDKYRGRQGYSMTPKPATT